MAEITINPDVLQQAKDTFLRVRDSVTQEIVRLRQLMRQFDAAMNQVRLEVVRSPQSASAEQLWYQVGLNEVASETLNGRYNIENERRIAATTSQELLAAHPGQVGNALRTYADSINNTCDRALSGYWSISNNLYPTNTISLSTYPWETDNLFMQVGGWLQRLAGELEKLAEVIARMLANESEVETAITVTFVPDTGSGVGTILAPVSASNGTADVGAGGGADVWSYLSSKYDLSSEAKGTLVSSEKSVGVSVDISGNLWDKGESTETKVAGVSIKDSNGIRLGVFGASAGLDASLDPNAEHWAQAGVSAEFTAVELYHEDVVGSDKWGVTDNANVKALSADAFAGFQDGTLGAQAGVDLVSATGGVGVNVAGVNVGVDATIGIKAELGIEIGKKVEVKLPFVSFGFSIGG